MILLYMTLSCVLFGSSADFKYEEVCYGQSFSLPFEYTPPLFDGQLYFTPSDGGSRKLMMDKKEAKDPRIQVSIGSVRLRDLTERDVGTFSISFNDDRKFNILTLKILDCAPKFKRYYGVAHYCDVPRGTEFLEFTPLHSRDQPKVLWNRTDPQTNKGSRGEMKRNVWEIIHPTQADSGYYNFRGKDNTLLSRIQLTVQENNRHYDAKVNGRLFIQYPSSMSSWTVTFTPEGGSERHTFMEEGQLVTTDFTWRIQELHNGIEIYPVESTDYGTFEFTDRQGNLAQTVLVVVNHESLPTFAYVVIIVGVIFGVIICCCCVRKCCCRKRSSKRDESAPQTAAAPAVYYHGEHQPAGPSYSAAPAPAHSYQPMNLLVSREPATTPLRPPVSNPVNPPQPEVAPLGGQGAAAAPSVGSDCLSSGLEPRFELKGLTVTSAPPLSSDTTFCEVYTSDKLNFL